MIIFGATGDLAKRKLFPSICNLAQDGYISDNFAILGVGRQEMSSEEFRRQALENLKEFDGDGLDKKSTNWFAERVFYTGGDFNDDEKLFSDITERLREICANLDIPENYLFYMAIPPSLFSSVTEKIVRNDLSKETDGNWRRFIFEKPFGHDLASAKELNALLAKKLKERQIYRIDHFLGKETVQNILVFRFGNSIFETIWNRNLVDHVQITVAETLGVEQRGDYYEKAGALRDMIPNHLFQLVTLTAMEPPVSFDADSVRDEQAKILQAIKPLTAKDAVRGQYGKSDGFSRSAAYRDESNVDPESNTETFVALELDLDNWRWAGVPFYLRTGKRLPVKHSSIIVQFKNAPFALFRDTTVERLRTNRIEIHIQPDEGITLHFGAKIPGPVVRVGAVDMDFNYVEHFGEQMATGYERLLFDAMIGDATLFQRADMVEASWAIVTPLLEEWASEKPSDFPNYAAGSWGAKAADELLEKDGRKWREPENVPEK